MLRSPIARVIGFSLSLVASALLSLAHGFVLVLCAEPDGCIEIEIVAVGESTQSGCVSHEHEETGEEATEHVESSGVAEECPCEDTVIAELTAPMPSKPAKANLIDVPVSAPIAAAASRPWLAFDRSGAARFASHTSAHRSLPGLERSVVRRN